MELYKKHQKTVSAVFFKLSFAFGRFYWSVLNALRALSAARSNWEGAFLLGAQWSLKKTFSGGSLRFLVRACYATLTLKASYREKICQHYWDPRLGTEELRSFESNALNRRIEVRRSRENLKSIIFFDVWHFSATHVESILWTIWHFGKLAIWNCTASWLSNWQLMT